MKPPYVQKMIMIAIDEPEYREVIIGIRQSKAARREYSELDKKQYELNLRAWNRRHVKPVCQLCGSKRADECGGCSTLEHPIYICENCASGHICLERRLNETPSWS